MLVAADEKINTTIIMAIEKAKLAEYFFCMIFLSVLKNN
jgi:hypothetical protein